MTSARDWAELVLAGGGASLFAALLAAWANRLKNRADVRKAVDEMARDWVAMANTQLKEFRSKNDFLERKVREQGREIDVLRGRLSDVCSLLRAALDALGDHERAGELRKRFEENGDG